MQRSQRRANRERPWTKPDQQDLINDALLKVGKEHQKKKGLNF